MSNGDGIKAAPRSKRCICIYGSSAGGKTTQLAEIVDGLRTRYGDDKIMRLVSASGGGWSGIQPAIDAGTIVPLAPDSLLRYRKSEFPLMERLCQGHWPADVEDPEALLIPPPKQPDWNKVIAYAFESMSEIGDWLMGVGIRGEAEGTVSLSGQDPAASFKQLDPATDEVEIYATPSMGSYGGIQSRVYQLIRDSRRYLQNRYVIWTAWPVQKGNVNVYGPKIVGSATALDSVGWFDLVTHVVKLENGDYDIFFDSHTLREGGLPKKYLAKLTADPRNAKIAEFLSETEGHLGTDKVTIRPGDAPKGMALLLETVDRLED